MSPHRSAHWDAPDAAGHAPGDGVAPMEERPQRGQYGERGYCAASAAHGMGPGLRGHTGIAAGRLHDRAERVDGLEQAPTAFLACWKPPPSARASSAWTPSAKTARRGCCTHVVDVPWRGSGALAVRDEQQETTMEGQQLRTLPGTLEHATGCEG